MNPLIQSIKNNNLHQLRLLIELGHDVNVKDDDGNSALHIAIDSKVSIDIIRLIIESGADVNAEDKSIWECTPLFYAVWENSKDVAELLIANGADVNAKNSYGITPLLQVIGFLGDNKEELSELLITNGADVNAQDNNGKRLIYLAAEYGHWSIVKLLEDNDAEYNIDEIPESIKVDLNSAITSKCLVRTKLALKLNPNLNQANEKNRTPLFYAIEFYHPEIIELLILHGAKPELLPRAQQEKCTILLKHLIARDIIEYLQSFIKHKTL